jgi:oligoendopeptidase F
LTLAHETGHGVHFSFSSKNPISLYEPGLPLAETASTFSETMMYEKLSSFEDLKLKNFSFFSQLDNYFATISRQIYFGMFEKEVHKNILTLHGIEDIAKIYSNNLKNLFGNSVSVSPDFSWEWLYVPHFFETPFYTYAYSFGNLLSIALYQRYKKEGKDFILNYKNILSSGGSKEPAKLLKENGFDISSRQFWQQGFDFIKEKVREAKKLYI